MKKLILLLSLIIICLTASAQLKAPKNPVIKPIDSIKTPKVYTLYLQTDSASTLAAINQLVKISQHLEASKSAHDEVQADQAFIKFIYELWNNEKKAQDKKK